MSFQGKDLLWIQRSGPPSPLHSVGGAGATLMLPCCVTHHHASHEANNHIHVIFTAGMFVSALDLAVCAERAKAIGRQLQIAVLPFDHHARRKSFISSVVSTRLLSSTSPRSLQGLYEYGKFIRTRRCTCNMHRQAIRQGNGRPPDRLLQSYFPERLRSAFYSWKSS